MQESRLLCYLPRRCTILCAPFFFRGLERHPARAGKAGTIEAPGSK